MGFYHPLDASFGTFSGKTLIVPIVSTANVAQLAVDLLVANLSLHLIGSFDSRDLVPVVGGREDGLSGLTTPLELFGKEDVGIVCIQQRSPVLKSRKQEFIDTLLEFIKGADFSAVLFLSGVDLSDRTDSQMGTPTFHIHPPNTAPWANAPLASIPVRIPEYTTPVSQHPTPVSHESSIPFIPGGGLTRRVLSTLSAQADMFPVPTASVLNFVLEGDNTPDARWLAGIVLAVLGIRGPEVVVDEEGFGRLDWREPASWKGLFGTPGDGSLYG
ncbi:hypothetical protein FA95DRAFT_1484608 [Auriscalpium vulgare]|uniref:Uncharacterized protein n=1 Tax=Auriscalpium vulgare TaxID=40419 RepID=A0ACB8S618_9AGAM|nr:hypothetical protein FA95DRAFT_1484608 [Auriscalpium vulgare]